MAPVKLVPCMQDVADLAKVHRTTVSLALRGHPSIPESTRARITKAAERVGYRMNPLISAMMSSRRTRQGASAHTTLAFITSSRPGQDWRRSQTLSEQFIGVTERARQQGFKVEEFPLYADGMTPARASDVLYNRGIVGLIIAPLNGGDRTLPLEWDRFAAVGIAFTLNYPNIPRVGNDHGESTRLCVRECLKRGYRRIGLAVQRYILERVEEHWLSGYEIEHAYPKRIPHPKPLIAEKWEKQSFLRWFYVERPDVVVTGGSYADVISWLKGAGLRVPGDVAVVSLDLHVYDGTVAGIQQDSTEIGVTVADLLIGRLTRNERGPLAVPIRVHRMGRWIEGSSLRPEPHPE